MKKFNREDLEFHLTDRPFKGLSKEYIMECIFNEGIQKKWSPKVGDVMVGCTGNIFVISSVDVFHKSIGGPMYYFGGGSCNRDGGCVMNSTYSFTANESGKYIHPIKGEQPNSYHSSIRDFRFVPYPHERGKNSAKSITDAVYQVLGKYGEDREDIKKELRALCEYILKSEKQ